MCYGFPCGWWNGWTETCSKPRGEDCPELLAADVPPDDDDALFEEMHVMDFLRGLLEEVKQARHPLNAGD